MNMLTTDLISKIRKIEIKSRGLSNQIFSGEYHSAFKGRGMAFSQVREYNPGDDIRSIDWNVTARFNHTFIKVFEEEREMTVMLLVDVSASQDFGTEQQKKSELVTELCATLAFSTITNNDKIGVIFFSDQIEKFIPPKKGKTHVLRIIRELIEFKPVHTKTNISKALEYTTNIIKKRSTTFLISDFLDADFANALRIAAKKHDLVALKVSDRREHEMPNIGLVKMYDAESGHYQWIDTGDTQTRNKYKAASMKQEKYLEDVFTRTGVDLANINTKIGYIKPLMTMFKKRGAKI
jgi:uncharacterized protein (DUF58 family)